MAAWIQTNGGFYASFLALLIAFNIVMTGIKAFCEKLKIREPSFLQKAGSFGAVVLGVLTANTTPKPPLPPQE